VEKRSWYAQIMYVHTLVPESQDKFSLIIFSNRENLSFRNQDKFSRRKDKFSLLIFSIGGNLSWDSRTEIRPPQKPSAPPKTGQIFEN